MSKKKGFNELLKSSAVPVLVDFYADWCQPCHTLSPIVQQVSREFGGKLKVIKVNVDKNRGASANYKVQNIPTLILFERGRPVWRQSGMIQKNQLVQALKSKIRA